MVDPRESSHYLSQLLPRLRSPSPNLSRHGLGRCFSCSAISFKRLNYLLFFCGERDPIRRSLQLCVTASISTSCHVRFRLAANSAMVSYFRLLLKLTALKRFLIGQPHGNCRGLLFPRKKVSEFLGFLLITFFCLSSEPALRKFSAVITCWIMPNSRPSTGSPFPSPRGPPTSSLFLLPFPRLFH